MDLLNEPDVYEWRIPRTRVRSILTWLMHVCAISTLYAMTFPGRHAWLWLLTVAYYWFFYARMLRFAVWTSGTLGLIHRARASSAAAQLQHVPAAARPDFVLLVPAFGAGRCIRMVAAIVSAQDYPADGWKCLFISDESEDISAADRAAAAAASIQEAVDRQRPPGTIGVAEAALLLLLADESAAAPLDYVRLFGLSAGQTAEAWAGLLTLLVARGVELGPDVPDAVRARLGDFMEGRARLNAKAHAEIFAMMGIAGASAPLLAGDHMWGASRMPGGLAAALSGSLAISGDSLAGLRARLRGPEYRDRIAGAYARENPATSSAIDEILERLCRPNLIHCRRPPGKRNKASALNFGFDRAVALGWVGPATHVMVLDSDSFLPANALAMTATEILRDIEPNVIRQLLPVTCTNFAGRNWFVRTIIAADAMASPGRWASNVRAQARSDLTAGSGVVIPTAFLKYLIATYGEAWDTSIICEDARMIMSQYAILDAASKRTKLVPAFVLEGAPEQERVVPTYVAFWRQRVRWSLGGMDELNSIRKVRLQHLLVSSRDFSPLPPGWRIVAQAQWRRFRLLISWLKEHLWWSGIVAAPVLWMIAEMACGAPPWEARLFGCLCIFLVPGLLLQTLFYRHVAPLIPGGVSRSQLVALLFALITLSIPMVLPVLFAQLVCLAGQRGRYAGWNPATPKPGSQFSMGNKDASEQILVTDAEKERV